MCACMYTIYFCLFSQPQAQEDDETEMDETENEGTSQDIDNDVAVEQVVKSIKEPTRVGKQSKKCQLEKAENELLAKAVKCLDQVATTSGPADTADGAELFGRYVASEMRMLDPPSQRWVKLQIQQILFHAQSQMDRQFASGAVNLYSPSQFSSGSQHSSVNSSPQPGRL